MPSSQRVRYKEGEVVEGGTECAVEAVGADMGRTVKWAAIQTQNARTI